jgi:hypothetical protein
MYKYEYSRKDFRREGSVKHFLDILKVNMLPPLENSKIKKKFQLKIHFNNRQNQGCPKFGALPKNYEMIITTI